jgi:hypothetical protein
MPTRRTKPRPGPRGPARQRSTARPPTVGFAAKLAVWIALVDGIAAAQTAAAARRIYERADAVEYLLVDLFAEADVDEAALKRAWAAMNERLETRIRALPPASDLVHELCCFRDLLNTT